jgi:hypothetical protein
MALKTFGVAWLGRHHPPALPATAIGLIRTTTETHCCLSKETCNVRTVAMAMRCVMLAMKIAG